MAPESHNEVSTSEPTNPNAINQENKEEQMEEGRKIRRLQLMMDMVMSVIGQDPNLTVDEAAEMVADSRRAALAMFPDKELAFNLLYKPRSAAPDARAVSNPVASATSFSMPTSGLCSRAASSACPRIVARASVPECAARRHCTRSRFRPYS